MAATTSIYKRIDKPLKNKAAAVSADVRPRPSDVPTRIPMTKVAKEKTLPLQMGTPNALTVATLKKSERGEDVHHAKDAEDLFNQLGI